MIEKPDLSKMLSEYNLLSETVKSLIKEKDGKNYSVICICDITEYKKTLYKVRYIAPNYSMDVKTIKLVKTKVLNSLYNNIIKNGIK